MDNKVTVLIPVGWKACYKKWLPEAIESVMQQTVLPNEIFIVDDAAKLDEEYFYNLFGGFRNLIEGSVFPDGSYDYYPDPTEDGYIRINYWRTLWRLGFADAFNCGMAKAENDLVIFLAADDKMMPTCIEKCLDAWHENKQRDAWYYMNYEVEGEGIFNLANNIAMTTKGFFLDWYGGFPPSAFSAPDSMLVSILMVHAPDKLYRVTSDGPLQWLRKHADQDTREQFSYFARSGAIELIRGLETKRFKPNPEWAKNV